MLLTALALLATASPVPQPALAEPAPPAVTAFGSIPDRELLSLRYRMGARASALLPPGACSVEDDHFRTEEGGCKDLVTGLVWGQHSTFTLGPVAWDTAVAYCDDLVEDGYDDWFLPTKDELLEVAAHEGTDSSDAWHLSWLPTYTYFSWSGTKRGSTRSWAVRISDETSILALDGSQIWFVCARQGSIGGGDATAVHVGSIELSTQNAGQGNKRGRAQVLVLDDLGAAVQGAQVTGTFSGDYAETVVASTDSNGVAVLTTVGLASGGISFGFCVDDVAITGLTYDSGANVETCDSF